MEIVKTYIVKIDGMLTTMYLLEDGRYAVYTPTSRTHEKFTSELEIVSKTDGKNILKNGKP